MNKRRQLVQNVLCARNELKRAEQEYREFVYSEDWGDADLYKSDIHHHGYYQKNGLCVSRFMTPRCKVANGD